MRAVKHAGDDAAETGEAVYQGRHAPRHPHGIAEDARSRAAAGSGEVNHEDAAGQTGGKARRGVWGAGLAKNQQVHMVSEREILQERG